MSLPTEITLLKLWKEDAQDRIDDNERVIEAQKARIADLEFHLGKCRDSAYQMCYATAGVLPIDYAPDVKPKKAKRVKA